MLDKLKISNNVSHQQRGAAAVEFAIISILLFTILFGILEFGRLFYIYNTVQEVTRSAAREAVVRWLDEESQDDVKKIALFGGVSLPAGAEINANNITIEYLTSSGDSITKPPSNAEDNILACLYPSESVDCIAFVRVSIIGATYVPMVGIFKSNLINLSLPIPASTVTMPAESMGYRSF